MIASVSPLIREDLVNLPGAARLQGTRFRSIFEEGDSPDHLYLVESGLAKLSICVGDRKEIVLGVVAPGQFAGLASVVLGTPRTSRAVFLTEAIAVEIPRTSFLEYCEENPSFWRSLTETLAHRQNDLYRKIQLLVLHDVEYRLLQCLLELAEVCGPDEPDGRIHSIPLSQEDVAVIIGATRETTSNKLNVLARRNLVILGRRRVVISSLEAVRQALAEIPN